MPGRSREVYLTDKGEKRAAKQGPVLAGQGLESLGGKSGAILGYADGTRVELGSDTVIREIGTTPGKRLFLDRGSLNADIAQQPKGAPMVLATPHGEAQILGTTLRIIVDPDPKKGTQVEVAKGKVMLKRLLDGKTVDVLSGHYAMAAVGVKLAARKPIFAEDFENAGAARVRWALIEGGFPARLAEGGLEIDISPRPADAYEFRGDLHMPGGVRGRPVFRLPVRVCADVEVTDEQGGVGPWLALVPSEAKEPYPVESLSATLDRGSWTLGWGLGEAVLAQAAGPWPRRDRWTLEMEAVGPDALDVRFLVNEQEVLKMRNSVRVFDRYRLELGASAYRDAAKGSRVRFDNVRVLELER
jgi:hypothetical protein